MQRQEIAQGGWSCNTRRWSLPGKRVSVPNRRSEQALGLVAGGAMSSSYSNPGIHTASYYPSMPRLQSASSADSEMFTPRELPEDELTPNRSVRFKTQAAASLKPL